MIRVVYPALGPYDAIAQHARGLVDELSSRGEPSVYVPRGARAITRAALARRDDLVVLEYMPFAYGRWGLAPGLVAAVTLTRVIPSAPPIALMVHEAAVEPEDARTRVMSLWQRLHLRYLARSAAVVLASTEANVTLVEALAGRRAVLHAPPPPNIPRSAIDRRSAREALGLEPDETVVATFGRRHPSRSLLHVEAALSALAGAGRRVTFLNLGADAPEVTLPRGVRELRPGAIEATAIADHLAAADLYLAPFSDGTSTRRTTLAAALRQGLPVVGTDGPQTDGLLRQPDGPCVLVPRGRVTGYADACRLLAGDAQERAHRGRAALDLYERVFSWRAVGDTFMTAIESARRARRS